MFKQRKITVLSIFFLLGLAYILRLFYIQVIDDSYTLSAENQSLRYVKKYAPRGLIFDRNGNKVVHNEAIYDLVVTPRFVKEDFDTTQFCYLFGISKKDFEKRLTKAKSYSRYKPSVFIEQITLQEFGPLLEKLYLYKAFSIQIRNRRRIITNNASHVIGYVGEVSQKILEEDSSYSRGDFIGVNGIEKSFEPQLKGSNGYSIYVANSKNILKEKYKNGTKDVAPIEGKDLTLGLDINLQTYGEYLMQHKKGSIVAIEPSTGEILSLVSSPSYDPNLLAGRDRSKNYKELSNNDSLRPLFNRALMAEYPPGSIFKLVQALIAMQEGDITEYTSFSCNKALVGCHDHPTAHSVAEAVKYSCNPYFHNVFREMLNNGEGSMFQTHAKNLDRWNKSVQSFGLGKALQVDIYGEKPGQIPDAAFYDKIYGKYRWAFSTIYSLSIGQGEILVSPIQMANLAAIMANRGFYYTPHLVKSIENDSINPLYLKKINSSVDAEYFEPVIQGMQMVVEESGGTARRARIEGVEVCGKTGTAQNPHGEDHSIFIAFAPKENPKIAISVYVENAGFGGTWAAPIASLMMEKYLKGQVQDTTKEQYILDKKFY